MEAHGPHAPRGQGRAGQGKLELEGQAGHAPDSSKKES
jgi:hypothetical protein